MYLNEFIMMSFYKIIFQKNQLCCEFSMLKNVKTNVTMFCRITYKYVYIGTCSFTIYVHVEQRKSRILPSKKFNKHFLLI